MPPTLTRSCYLMSDALELAQALYDADLARLATLTADQVDYLDRLDEIPDPSGEGVECGDGPHLTAVEWAYIGEVSGGR
jgi:hypothetical protein